MGWRSLIKHFGEEVGVSALRAAGKDIQILLLTRFLRMFAFGASTLILAMFFSTLGYSATDIGLFFTFTLVGDMVISLALSLLADALGRRLILILGSLSMMGAGVCFAVAADFWLLLFAATIGVISPTGNEIGPFRAVEESTLAQLSDVATRSDIYAWYVVFGTLGAAGGSFSCGWYTQYLQSVGWREISSYKFIFWIYAVIGLLKAIICLFLNSRCEIRPGKVHVEDYDEEDEVEEPFIRTEAQYEADPTPESKHQWLAPFARLSRKSTMTLLQLCGLFFFDSLASGMVPITLITFFMEHKFEMSEGQLGTIISVAQFMSSVGNIFASAVAKRVGLVKAMVFIHLPSAILLALVPAPPFLTLTVVILVARATLASMDQAPRSAFLSAVALPEERTVMMGIVNTVETMSQTAGPLITGLLAYEDRFWGAFVIAGCLKASYDLGLLAMFLHVPLDSSHQNSAPRRDRDRNGCYGPHRLEDFDSDSEIELDNHLRGKEVAQSSVAEARV